MDYVKLYWQRRNLEEIRDNESPALFMFSRGIDIIFIGIAYKTGLKTEIIANLKRLKQEKVGLNIWITKIVDSSYKHVTEKLYIDTEHLLAFIHKIMKNRDYDMTIHRDDLKIFNYECNLLFDWIKVSNGKFNNS